MAVLKESTKQIVGVSSFIKDKGTDKQKNFFRVEYVDWQKSGTYIKDWVEHDKLDRVLRYLIVDWEKISNDKNFAWKEISQICQELSWKSLIITTEIK